MNDNRSRQPKGIPTGGEFAKNAHGDAPGGLPNSVFDGYPLDDLPQNDGDFEVSPDPNRVAVDWDYREARLQMLREMAETGEHAGSISDLYREAD